MWGEVSREVWRGMWGKVNGKWERVKRGMHEGCWTTGNCCDSCAVNVLKRSRIEVDDIYKNWRKKVGLEI